MFITHAHYHTARYKHHAGYELHRHLTEECWNDLKVDNLTTAIKNPIN